MANPSPDEGVRAALEAFLDQGESRDEIKCRYCGDSHAGNNCRVTGGHDFDATGGTVWEFSGEAVEALRAALSTPVPEEGLPRGSASAAEFTRQPLDFEERQQVPQGAGLHETLTAIAMIVNQATKHRGNAGKEGLFLDAIGIRAKAALASAEAGDGVAAALPSPLPSQGGPVALKPIGYASPDDFAKPIRASDERSIYLMGKPSEVWSWPIYRPEDVAEALAAERARADKAEEDRDFALYCLYHADFAEIGMRYPDDGVSICTGLNLNALAAAKRLQAHGLVTINDGPAGPLVAWAPGRGRARTILKETPHGER